MEANVKVSVIVPIYKVEKYLERCIESIRNQTYSNLEILLVDDGSPDRCPQMCDSYAQADDRIIVIHKRNGGLSDARNAGIERASGDYLIFVDSDDWIHKQFVEVMVEMIETGHVRMAVCGYQYVYEGNEYQDTESELPSLLIQVRKLTSLEAQEMYFADDFLRTTFTVAWNKIYARELFQNIRYPQRKLHEDEFTTFKLIHETEEVCFLNVPLYYYLSRTDSIMGDFKSSRFDIFAGYMEKIKYFSEWGHCELAVKILFHAMHMLMQFVEWTREAGFDGHSRIADNRYALQKMVRQYGLKKNFTVIQRLDYFLFCISINWYYKIWKYSRHK